MTNSDITSSFYLLQARPHAKYYTYDLISRTTIILILHRWGK